MAYPAEQSFELYLHDIHDLPLLEREEEQRLVARLRDGRQAAHRLRSEQALTAAEQADLERVVADGEHARAILITAHLRLVIRIARQYTSRGVSLLDLIQEGNLALLEAAEQFEPEHGVRFATYAVWWIRHAIGRAVAETVHPVRLPQDLQLKLYRLHRARSDLSQRLGREPYEQELAGELDLPVAEIAGLARYLQPVLSLDAPLSADGDSDLADLVHDPVAELQLNATLQAALAEELEELLRHLTTEEQKVLVLRFGLRGHPLHSRQEVATRLGMTSERVQRLEARALRKLRDPEFLQRLRDSMTS